MAPSRLEGLGLSWAPSRLEDLGLSWAPSRLEGLGLSWAPYRLEDLGLAPSRGILPEGKKPKTHANVIFFASPLFFLRAT